MRDVVARTVARLSSIALIGLVGIALAAEPRIVIQRGHTDGVCAVAVSPDGRFLVTGGEDNLVKLWDIASGKEMRSFVGHENWVLSVAFSPDGKRVYSSSRDGMIKQWDVENGKEILTIKAHRFFVNSIALSPDGTFLASCAENTTALFLWDTATARKIREFVGHKEPIQALAYSPDGRKILSAGVDKTLRLWDEKSGKCVSTMGGLFGHGQTVTALAISPDGQYAISGSEDCTVRLWDLKRGSQIRTFQKMHSGYNYPNALAFSPDGKSVASGSWSGYLTLWDVKTGKAAYFEEGRAASRMIAFLPDGKTIASGCALLPMLSDAATGKAVRDFHSYAALLWSGDLSSDEKQVIVPSYDKSLKFWDVENGSIKKTIANSNFQICDSAIFSPDMKDILLTEGPFLRLYTPEASGERRWKQEHTQLRSTATIYASAFSPDGNFVLTGARDGTLKLWDRRTGDPMLTYSGHGDGNIIYDAAFSPDGKTIASVTWDQPTLILWDTASGKILQSRTGRSIKNDSVAWA